MLCIVSYDVGSQNMAEPSSVDYIPMAIIFDVLSSPTMLVLRVFSLIVVNRRTTHLVNSVFHAIIPFGGSLCRSRVQPL